MWCGIHEPSASLNLLCLIDPRCIHLKISGSARTPNLVT